MRRDPLLPEPTQAAPPPSASRLRRVHADPAIASWANAPEATPIWTGHQPWTWHPGILAKYFAVDAAASARPASSHRTKPCINLVVDHDVHETLRLDVPRFDAAQQSWTSHAVTLASMRADVPAGCQPAVDPSRVLHTLREQAGSPGVSLEPLIAAWSDPNAREAENLGQQMAGVLRRLMQPWLRATWEDRFSTTLCEQPWFSDELSALLQDGRPMAEAYHRAVAAAPAAGVASLAVSRELVELPVWLLAWNQPRRRVYADLADTTPWLVDEHGRRLDLERGLGRHKLWLAPKALWMTALIRRRTTECAGFVHGSGGVLYDQAMQHWWQRWRGEPLAPLALATADVTLDLPGPTATASQHRHAVWLAHHLPHNLDRIPSVAAAHPELVAEKQALLAHMHDDRDRPRRRAAFHRLHTINAALADAHHVLIDRAHRDQQHAAHAVRNARLAQRRDWAFALHPAATLTELRQSTR